ncbi:MAG TPA: hypothetical protein VNU19_23780 [Candidatus Acidoferrum sp.]|nr:hypothetical protein [Candidatus Acidoferrum sp.]
MGSNHAPRDGIVLSGLRKSFGPVQAVRGIDISIAPGVTVTAAV